MVSDILQQVAQEAGETLLAYFQKELRPEDKMASHQNLVTKADVASQKTIQNRIIELMVQDGYKESDIGFTGEENLETPGLHRFIIDPLDGTNNFASGHDYFCISIGYVNNNVLTAGVIYQPTTSTLYMAMRGSGAYKVINGVKETMRVVPTPIRDSILLSYMSSRESTRAYWISKITRLHTLSRGLRIFGACALDCARFADRKNNCNIVVYAHSYLWDIAAAQIIVKEAGGIMTDWKGTPLVLNFNDPRVTYEVLVCHPGNLGDIAKILSSS